MTDAEALAMTRLNCRRTIGYVLNVARFRGIEVVIYNRYTAPIRDLFPRLLQKVGVLRHYYLHRLTVSLNASCTLFQRIIV